MKLYKIFIAIFVTTFVVTNIAFSAHFTREPGSSDKNMTVVLPADVILKIGDNDLKDGDEIAAFTENGVCVGAGVWKEEQTSFAVFGYEKNGFPLGPKEDDQLYFRIWDSYGLMEYTSVAVTVDPDAPLATPDTKYVPNGIMYIVSMYAAAVPGKPTFTNPVPYSKGAPLTGTITISPTSNAATSLIELHDKNDFSNVIASASGNITSLNYSNLNYNTQYYVRARSSNDAGDGPWETMGFGTILKTPELTSPTNNLKGRTESVKLEWNTVSGATGFDIQVSTDSTFNSGVTNYSTGLTYYNVNNLNNNTTYFWRVRATGTGGNFSEYSAAFSFSTRIASTTITAPTDNERGVGINGTIKWTAVDGANTYRVRVINVATNVVAKTVQTILTSYNYTGLETYTYYRLTAQAEGTNGNGVTDTIYFYTIYSDPTLVYPANGSYANDFTTQFTWNAVAGAEKYDIRISKVQDFSADVIYGTDINSTSYTVNNLYASSRYFWQVRAKGADGVGAYSGTFEFNTKLATPTITSPANNEKGIALINARIDWGQVQDANQYIIEVSKSPTFATLVFDNTATAPYIYLSGLDSKTDYYARVKAKNASNSSDYSAVVKFTTRLGQVTLSSPTQGAYGVTTSGTLNWELLAGANSYNVIVSSNSDLSNPVVNTNVATNSYNYSGLSNNTMYYWYVSGVDNDGEGQSSSVWHFTTNLSAPTLASPANASVGNTFTNLQLKWNAVATANKYQVQVSTSSNFSNIIINTDVANATSYTIPSLSTFTTYYWRVKAFSQTNSSDFSSSFWFKTNLGKVTLSSPVNSSEGFSTTNGKFMWIALNGAISYDIVISENSNLSNPVVNANVSTTSYNVASGVLSTSKVYYWAVRGKDGNALYGEYSNTNSFGTLLTTPTLISPSNGATNIAFDDVLKWTSSPRADSYYLRISKEASLNNPIFSEYVSGTQHTLSNLESNTKYYWAVTPMVSYTLSNASSTFSFTTMTLPPPSLVYPSNNAIDLYTNVDFVWTSVQEAVSYNFRYAGDPNMQNILGTTNNISGITHSVSGLFKNRAYYWQVQTVSSEGTSNWSNIYKFNTFAPISFNGATNFCENRTTNYTAPVSNLVDYQWSVTGGSIVGSSTNNVVSIKWGNSGTGVVTLNRSSAIWGNYTDQLSMNVDITNTNVVNVNLSADTYNGNNEACVFEIINLSSDLTDNDFYEYVWMLDNNVISNDKSFDYQFTSDGEFTFDFYAIGDNCKAALSSITVNVSNNCDLTVVSLGDVATCKNSPAQLVISVYGGSGFYDYSWSPSADFINSHVQNPLIASVAVTKTYTVTVTDVVSQRQAMATVKVTASSSPSIKFTPATLMVYSNQALDFTDEDVLAVTITNGTGPFSYYWTDDFGFAIDPTNVIPALGRNYYNLTVVDANGCASATKRFIVYNLIKKDNINDNFVVGITGEGLMMNYPNPVSNNMNIFVDFEQKQNVRIRIMNMIGQNVYQESLGELEIYDGQISVSNLSAGVYTLIIESDMNSFVKTFIKQ